MPDELDSTDQDFREAMDLHRRQISEEQFQKFEGYMQEILTSFGMEPNTPATIDTPRRFVRALFDITAGYEGDPTPTVNLYVAAAQNAQSRAGGGARGGDNGWHTRFSAGNYNDDNSVGYVSVPGVGVIGSYGH